MLEVIPSSEILFQINKEKSVNKSTLDSVLDVSLTVENINTYADDALGKLINFVGKKVENYKQNNSVDGLSDMEVEDKAFKYYELGDINSIMDCIAEKSKEIKNLDKIINKADQIDRVIVHPDSYDPMIDNGNGEEVKEKRIIDRLKTTLFVLKEDFGVDVYDEKQLNIQKGIIDKNMMRRTSYFTIDVPKIDRLILVCNEEGNASYVFNSLNLEKLGINKQQIADSTKMDLNGLIEGSPDLGKRIIYSKNHFVPRMIDSIKHPESNRPDEMTVDMKETGKYLYQKADEDELSCRGLAKKLGMGNMNLSKIIDQISPDELGTVILKKFKTKTVPAYNLKQQQVILKKLEERGFLMPIANEDELSCLGLARKLGVGDVTLSRIISKIIPDELGDVNLKKFGSQTVPAYTPEQQEIITKKVEEQGLFKPVANEDELSCFGLAKKLGVSTNALSKIISGIDLEVIGPVELKKIGAQVVPAYTLEQQRIITETAEKQNLLVSAATENYLSSNGLAKKLGIVDNTIKKIIKQISPEELGQVNTKKFSGNIVDAYSPEQQLLISEKVKEQGLLVSAAEKDDLSGASLAKKLRVNVYTLNEIIDQINSEELGLINLKKFSGKITAAYNLDQQKIIKRYLDLKRNKSK